MATAARSAGAVSHGRRERTRRKVGGQRLLAGGVFWILAVAVLLAGIVAVNLAVLRLNLSLDSVNRERAKLKADNAALASQLASAKKTGLVVTQGSQSSGLVPADPATTQYVRLSP